MSPHGTLRAGALLLMSSLIATCETDSGGTVLQLERVVAPDDACKLTPANDTLGVGSYDPAPMNDGYLLGVALRNNMETADSDPRTLNAVNVRPRSTDLQLIGFEGCWYQYNGDVTRFGDYRNSGLMDCDKIPNQSASIPSQQKLEAGGLTSQVAVIRVLTRQHLKQLFGSNYEPQLISTQSGTKPSSDGSGRLVAFSSLEKTDPASPTRDPNWGQFYPPQYDASVVVQLRGVASMQSGLVVRSNWLHFVINVCTGCTQTICGPLEMKRCSTGYCDYPSNTVACQNNSCTNGTTTTPCPVADFLSGRVPSYGVDKSGQALCLPTQNFVPPACDVPNLAYGCDATSGT